MFELDSCVAFITSNTSKKLEDFFNDKLINQGSTRVQWIALYYLGKYGSISQIDLAKKMNIKSSTIVRLIDRMERDGYVVRVKDSKDRRITNLELTSEGMKLREKLLPVGQMVSEIFSKNITEDEFKVFMTVLNKMVDNTKSEI